ncbi:hypothetical protein DL93DRAFT_2095841 [Clavulina sp. PMI_390]|nr:hypothetical protein DL93DRAFT_2095841 [Clavulina sp. PMI_390]
MSESERSVSRGRDAVVSTGRGGAGNMMRGESVSRGRVSRERDGDERGRELSPTAIGQATHSGRGGAGNIRSPSRDPAAIREELLHEREVIDATKNAEERVTFSTGRGGIGNMRASPNTSVSRERSAGASERSRSTDPAPGKRYMSSGRGGRGNIHHDGQHTQHELEKLDEDERVAAGGLESGQMHSTGRGGAGNLTNNPDPDASHPTAEAPLEEGVHSTGKGGYGNITHNKEAAAGADRGRSDTKHPTGLAGMWDKVTHGFQSDASRK